MGGHERTRTTTVGKTTADFCFEHPLGPILACWSSRGLRRLELPNPGKPAQAGEPAPRGAAFPGCLNGTDAPRHRQLHAALTRYFSGQPEDFRGIPLDIGDATPFQRSVWLAARDVKWGETVTYGELAVRAGLSKRAARAVGNALGDNPIPIIIPCHRILATGGKLGGFSAGLCWKRELLRLEGYRLPQ